MSASDRRRESADSPRREADGSPTERASAVDERPAVAVGADEPAARCPYCGLPFHEERLETLHRGLEHPASLSDRERAAFERAYREEDADVRRFRLLALGAVVLCYFCLLFVYAVIL
ncbi:DUF7410 domain-containing protein [Haloterrigena alkaliphila]|uniref:DUF7410 domain-containing protein n=1 Tax=Haloterrigena alkaliphila TaxID=2816475 RepID=A0A8A2V9X9_9EURY|nr:hypothetical protein [Haloterrigena alkaliphila]QSW98281.1 hypothetical protein J0X25_12840 [Haloterrigena alkaliphila]